VGKQQETVGECVGFEIDNPISLCLPKTTIIIDCSVSLSDSCSLYSLAFAVIYFCFAEKN